MTNLLVRIARRVVRRPVHWLAPLMAALFLANGIVTEASRGPWPQLLAFLVPLALMLGIAPFLPVAALAIMTLMPAAQLLGLAIGPEANTWVFYLAVPLTALVLGSVAEGLARRLVLPVGLVVTTMIAYLISVPQGAEGGWSEWTGLVGGPRVHPRQDDFIGIALVGLGLYLGCWGVGVLFRLGVRGRFDSLIQLLSESPTSPQASPGPVVLTLTAREQEIYVLVSQGLSNAEIAVHEHISETTVKSHVRAILRKLELRSRSQIAAHAHGQRPVAPGAASRLSSGKP